MTKQEQRRLINHLLRIIDGLVAEPSANAYEAAMMLGSTMGAQQSFQKEEQMSGEGLDWPVIAEEGRFSIKVRLILDKLGQIKMQGWSNYFAALDGVNLQRIHTCQVCDRLFYAPREDSRGCSTRHMTTLYQRAYRERNKPNET